MSGLSLFSAEFGARSGIFLEEVEDFRVTHVNAAVCEGPWDKLDTAAILFRRKRMGRASSDRERAAKQACVGHDFMDGGTLSADPIAKN